MTQQKSSRFEVRELVIVGLMTAVCFVANYIQIKIPLPIGVTRIHFGNIFCLLSALLLGPTKGGLSAGLGSMIYDLTDAAYVATSPFTLVFKFTMAFIAGKISYGGGSGGTKQLRNFVGAGLGSLTYTILYVAKNFLENSVFLRQPLETCFTIMFTQLPISLLNGVIAVIASVLLAPVFKVALKKSGLVKI